MPEVETPDSVVEFPDSMGQDEILGVLRKKYPKADPARQLKKEQLAQEMEQARTQGVVSELQTKFFGGLGKAAELATQLSPPTLLKRVLQLPTQAEQAAGLLPANAPDPLAPMVSPSAARKAVDYLDPNSYDEPGSMREGVKQFVADTLSGLTSPDQAAALLAGVKEPELVGRMFQIETAKQAPEAAQNLVESVKSGDKEAIGRSAAALLASTAIPVSIEKGLRNARTQPETGEVQKAQEAQVAPEDLRPAVKIGDKIVLGDVGDKHADILTRAGKDPESIPHEDERRGFADVNNPNVLIPRGPAEKIAGVEGTADAGGLDSRDLNKVKAAPESTDAAATASAVPPEAPLTGKAETPVSAGAEPAKVEPSVTTPVTQPVGMGAAVPQEFEQPGSYVSNMFAAIDRDRVEMGKPPMEPGAKRTWDQDNQTALARMNRDPGWIPSLINEVLNKPRPLLSWENAGLAWQRQAWKDEANNAMKRIALAFDDGRDADLAEAQGTLARFEDDLDRLDRAVGRGGTGSEAGRTLQAQKMGAGDDFSLVEMRLQRRAAKGGQKLTPQEDADIKRQFDEYQKTISDLQKHVSERDAKLAEAASREAFLEAQKPKASDYVIGVAEKWVKQLDTKADAARQRLKERLSRLSAGVDPTILLDLAEVGAAHIGHVGLDFAKWSARMIEDLGEKVRPFLQDAYEASKAKIDALATPKEVKAAIKRTKDTAQDIAQKVKIRTDKGVKEDISSLVQKMARMIVQEGVQNRDELIDRVHGILKDNGVNLTRRETMDAISGYGQFKRLTKDQVSVELRDLKGQMQQVAKLEDMAAKKAPLKTGIERRAVSDEERRLITLVNNSKYNGGYQITDPETQLKSALQTWKTNARNRMVDLQRKIDEGDYSRKQRRELHLDTEAVSMRANLEQIKKQWQDGLRKLENSQRASWRKGADAFVRWERAFKLSSPVVFGKLAAAAATRAVTTGAEEAVGGVLSKVPGISRVAEQAPREGGLNVKAMAEGLSDAIIKGGKDAWDTARKGAADIDFVYGGKLVDKDWANIFGQLHGALKAPIKRGEFRLSLEKRIEHAIRNGVDPTDPFVQTRLATEALNDAYRSIFMQHGFTSDMFNQLVTQMEKSQKYPVSGELTARIARFFFPVVRVPLNIVSETATGVHGLATASARTMYRAMNGTLDGIDPQVADSIMRQFKKGSIGLGLIALGYMNPGSVGGYDWREKRKPGAVKTGGFQIGGVNIPRWMTHAPWFELMQIGATLKHVKDQHVGKTGETKGISEGAWAAAFGLLEETPFVGQMVRAARASMSTNERNAFLGELAKSTVVPQAVQKIAEVTDPTTGKRTPKTIGQHIEMGVPGMRENVPAKRVTP